MTENLETKVAVLEKEFGRYNDLIEKFDITIDRLTEVSNSIRNLVVLHEQRLTQQEKKTDDLNHDVNADLKKISERLSALETWKWTLAGAAAAIGFFASKIDISKFFTFGG